MTTDQPPETPDEPQPPAEYEPPAGYEPPAAPEAEPPPPPPDFPPLDYPVRIRVEDTLERRRLTVFFRLLLALPHLIWLGLWGIFALIATIINWFAVLIRGQTPDGLHRFLTSYIRYSVHVMAYFSIAANRFPGFVGDPGYEVDVDFDPPARQNRWTVAFRLILAIPVLLLAGIVGIGGGTGYNASARAGNYVASAGGRGPGLVLGVCALLAWWYALVRKRSPEGVTRLSWYSLHYGAQVAAYFSVLTDRYPTSSPAATGVPRRPPPHPIVIAQSGDDLRRSRVTVFFRILLFLPHYIWLQLWGYLVAVLALVNWLVTLIAGRSPRWIHNFFVRYLRYTLHVYAFTTLVGNPFPGFAGMPGTYPVDVTVAPPERQRRLVTAFRLLLVIPAFILQSTLLVALFAVAVGGWFAALVTGRMPRGLRNLGAFALRYTVQTNSYGYLLLTDRYPYAGPPA